MKFDKTIGLKQWDGGILKFTESKILSLGEALCMILANQGQERQFDPFKTFSFITKINEGKKEIEIDDADFDKLLKIVEHDKFFTTNGDWVRGQIIDILKKENTKPKS